MYQHGEKWPIIFLIVAAFAAATFVISSGYITYQDVVRGAYAPAQDHRTITVVVREHDLSDGSHYYSWEAFLSSKRDGTQAWQKVAVAPSSYLTVEAAEYDAWTLIESKWRIADD